MRRERKGAGARRSGTLLAIVGLAALGLGAFRVGEPPEMGIRPELPGIGRSTVIELSAREAGRGLYRVRADLVQGDREIELAVREYTPRPPWAFWGDRTTDDAWEVEVGTASIEGLLSGEAVVRLTAWPAPSWLRRPDPVVRELTLPVRLSPPSLAVLSTQHYVSPGGSGVVVYSVGDSAARHGVAIGDWWFPGFELPGAAAPGTRFALFAVPFDLEGPAELRLTATDEVGNEAVRSFVDRWIPRRYETDTIRVSEGFFAQVVPEILGNTPGIEDRGDLFENWLWINRELRARNAATLIELGRASRPEFLWTEPFLPMRNAQVMSAFADRRTYVYEGREVDRQDHLGFDLASVKKDAIEASNDGIVVLARYFGIYGNAVVLDHGYGLQSLYGHLSSIEVEQGQSVGRGVVLGRSGETGLAAGDHLHFTMLIAGRAVTPVEWWDGAWIRDRVRAKLEAAR